MKNAVAGFVAPFVLVACASTPKPPPSSGSSLPGWVDNPYFDQKGGVICGVGISDLVAADESAGRSDAEADGRNKVASELQTQVNRMIERTNLAMKDFAKDAIIGQKVSNDIAEQLTRQTITGSRATDYFYFPDRSDPKKLYVRIQLSVDSHKLAEDLTNQIADQLKEKIQSEHEKAMDRLHQAVEAAVQAEQTH